MQANHPSVQGKGLFVAMVSIARKEGIRGLYSVSEFILNHSIVLCTFFTN